MLNSKKFTFGESFLNNDGAVIVPAVENARSQGFDEGYASGYATAKSELESDVLAMVTVLNMRLDEVSSRQQASYEFVTNSTMQVVKAIINKVIPHVFSNSGDQEVVAFVNEALKGLSSMGEMTVFVHPDLHKSIETLVQEKCSQFGDQLKILVKKDAELERTDCKVTWDDGGIEQIKSKLLVDVDQALDRVLSNAPAPQEIIEGEKDV